jgi:hypothetical protein
MAEQSRRVAADWQFQFSFQITFSLAIIEYPLHSLYSFQPNGKRSREELWPATF